MSKTKLADRIMAQALSAGSAAATEFPLLNNPVGRTGRTIQIPLRWRSLHPDTIQAHSDADWVTYEPDMAAGKLPKSFKQVIKLSVDAARLQELKTGGDLIDAVSYKLVTMAMVGHAVGEMSDFFTVAMKIRPVELYECA